MNDVTIALNVIIWYAALTDFIVSLVILSNRTVCIREFLFYAFTRIRKKKRTKVVIRPRWSRTIIL